MLLWYNTLVVIMMKKKLIIITILLLLLDQISKVLVTKYINLGSSISIIPSFFDLTYIENTGAALNILSGKTLLLISISLIALIYIIKMVLKTNISNNLQLLTYSMLISGVIGNVVDRIFYGKVIDFLSFHIASYNFPVFNIADSLIVIGAFLLILSIIKEKKNEN